MKGVASCDVCRDWCRFCKSRDSHRSSLAGWQAALLNPRPYLSAGAYAACFGVELTVANIVTLYLFNQFKLSLTVAGLLGEDHWWGGWPACLLADNWVL
jgi:nitrate/nitrite transporter NarK